MNWLKTIKRLHWVSVWELIKLALFNIRYLWPTYRATKQCMAISSEHFGRKHYQNGPANAFRHALWNILIAKKCFALGDTLEKVMAWTRKITDWHEEAFFSKELPMKMDYHNNAIGRMLFFEHWQWSQEQLIQHLLDLTKKAVKVDRDTNFNEVKNQLVFITDGY